MLNCDINLWIFLQNIKTLDYEYLCETQEYDLFKSAQYYNTGYTISLADIIDDKEACIKYQAATFTDLLYKVKFILESFAKINTLKYRLLMDTIPIIERIAVENTLRSLSL